MFSIHTYKNLNTINIKIPVFINHIIDISLRKYKLLVWFNYQATIVFINKKCCVVSKIFYPLFLLHQLTLRSQNLLRKHPHHN